MDLIRNFGNFNPRLLDLKPTHSEEESAPDAESKETELVPTLEVEPRISGKVLKNADMILADYIRQIEVSTSRLPSTSGVTPGATTSNTDSKPPLTGPAAGDFDLSVVPGLNDDFASFYTQVGMSALGSATSKNTIDEGYWDKALDALDKLRPQLHEYIKAQLEARGLKYDESVVDKFISYFITQSVEMALVQGTFPTEQTADNWESCNQQERQVSFKFSNVVEALLSLIDGELGIDSEHYAFGTKMGQHNAPDAFSEESWNKTDDLNHNKLQYTADKFLNQGEKMLKTVLVGMEIPDDGYFGETVTSSRVVVNDVLKLYQDTVRGYLKQTYSDLTDAQIDDILEKALNDIRNNVDSMKITRGMNNGKYNLELILQNYGAKCEEILRSDYPEAAVNHHEGYLYGQTAPRASEINREASARVIENKLGTDNRAVINTILDALAAYGDKIGINDLEGIIDKLIEIFGNDDTLADRLYEAAGTYNSDTNESILKDTIDKAIEGYLDDKEHHAGLLFGIGGGMAAAQVRVLVSSSIKEKFPDLSDEDVSKVIEALASFGDKISNNDLDEILDKLANEYTGEGNIAGLTKYVVEQYLAEPKPDTEPIVDQEMLDKMKDNIFQTSQLFG